MDRNPNVLWVTLESTRWDHTSLADHDRDTTPNLRRIADGQRARSFDWCFSEGIWTRSVSASILTGTYPSHHGAGMFRQSVPDSLATVPELLGREGYRTVAVSPNANLSAATGLDRGFDDFVWIEKSTLLENVGPRTLLKFLLNIRRHGAGLTTDTRKHNTGYMMTDVAKRWLRRHGDDGPFFMYLHYGDPHHPYYPPRPMFRRQAERHGITPEAAEELVLDHHADLAEHVARGLPYTDREWEALLGMYDAGIEYADRLVGHLIDVLESTVPGETIVVVTADHGELFGEEGLLGHRVSVHDALARVPMVVDGLDAALEDDGDVVQHVDVMQAILDAVGADTRQFQGVTLGAEPRSNAFIQRGWDRCKDHLDSYRDLGESFDADRFHAGDLSALRTREFKLLMGDERTTLYRPPDETTDVSDRYPEVAATLESQLTEWLESVATPVTATDEDADLSTAARRQLSDLGYLVD